MLWLIVFLASAYVSAFAYGHLFFDFRIFGPPPTLWELVEPWLCILGPQTAVAIVLIYRHYKRKRGPTGLCERCGYDLRATPDRCPECGTVPASAHGSASD